MVNKLKIKKNDNVLVLSGKDKGKKGKILKVFPDVYKVLVEGVNLATKHIKPSKQDAGKVVRQEAPIHYSNVALLDPDTGLAIKVGYKFLEDGTKVRISRSSGKEIKFAEV